MSLLGKRSGIVMERLYWWGACGLNGLVLMKTSTVAMQASCSWRPMRGPTPQTSPTGCADTATRAVAR